MDFGLKLSTWIKLLKRKVSESYIDLIIHKHYVLISKSLYFLDILCYLIAANLAYKF